MDLPHFDKKKALIYGGGFAVVIVLFMLFRNLSGGGSASSTVVTQGTDPAVLQAQTSLALAQIGAATAAQQTNAQLAAAQMAAQNDLAEHTIDADLSRYSIDAQTHQLDVQVAAAAASDARNADLQASVARWTLDNAAQMQANNNAFQLTYAANANASAESIAQMQAELAAASIHSNENVTIAGLAAQTAQLNGYLGAQVAMNESDNAKEVGIAKISSSTQKHSSTMGLIGGIIGGALSIFSDETLKTDLTLIGREPDGLGIYSYRMIGDPNYTVGVLAQEVKRLRPGALGPVIEGKFTVKYRELAAAA
jgi:hypothetical protein